MHVLFLPSVAEQDVTFQEDVTLHHVSSSSFQQMVDVPQTRHCKLRHCRQLYKKQQCRLFVASLVEIDTEIAKNKHRSTAVSQSTTTSSNVAAFWVSGILARFQKEHTVHIFLITTHENDLQSR